MDFLQMLPVEISIIIWNLLDLRDILSCQAVCHAWYDFTNNNVVWKTFWDGKFPLNECRQRTDLSMMLGIPCKWKMHFVNHMRVIKNWRENRYKRYEKNFHFHTTAYDGKTLVIGNISGLYVYKIHRGNLIHIQKFNYKKYCLLNCATNTNYIAAKFKPFVLIYQLVNGKYILLHTLYTQGMNPESICVQQQFVSIQQMDEIEDKSKIDPELENMCIIEDTLFVYVPHVKIVYAWDMKELRKLMEFNHEISYWINDKTNVYICCDRVINVYDQSGEMCLSVNTNQYINRILVNQNIFLADLEPRQGKGEICCWDKVTGKELMTRKIASYYFLLHPKENILFYIIVSCELDRVEIFALDLNNNVTLWKTRCGEHDLLFDLHSIVADKFLLFFPYDSSNVFHILDTKTGNYLYSLPRVDVFSSYDILIYDNDDNDKKWKTVIHIYL